MVLVWVVACVLFCAIAFNKVMFMIDPVVWPAIFRQYFNWNLRFGK